MSKGWGLTFTKKQKLILRMHKLGVYELNTPPFPPNARILEGLSLSKVGLGMSSIINAEKV